MSLSTAVAHTFLPTEPTLCGNPSARRRGFQTALAKQGSLWEEYCLERGRSLSSGARLWCWRKVRERVVFFFFLGGSKRETLEAGCLSTAGLIKRAP